MNEFDENKAVQYIKQNAHGAAKYTDDDILLTIDTMMDYYESLDDDAPDEAYDIEAVAAYVAKQLKRDKQCAIASDDVPAIVAAELEYEDTLEL